MNGLKFNAKKAKNIEIKKNDFGLLMRFMVFPSTDEVDAFNSFLFCGDLLERETKTLADRSQVRALKYYVLPVRIINKYIFKDNSLLKELFWPCGTAAYTNRFMSIFYRINIILWNCLKFLLRNH